MALIPERDVVTVICNIIWYVMYLIPLLLVLQNPCYSTPC